MIYDSNIHCSVKGLIRSATSRAPVQDLLGSFSRASMAAMVAVLGQPVMEPHSEKMLAAAICWKKKKKTKQKWLGDVWRNDEMFRRPEIRMHPDYLALSDLSQINLC